MYPHLYLVVEKEKTTEIYLCQWQGQNSSALSSIQTGHGAYPAS